MTWLYLAGAIVAEVIATSFLKQSEGFTQTWPTVICTVGYGTAFWLLSLALKTIPTGVAYAVWSGLGTVLIVLVAWLWQDQKLDAAALAGIGLIVAGVAVMNLFSRAMTH